MCAGEYFAFFLFLLMHSPGCIEMGEVQAKEIHYMHEEKKDFLVPCGILYCSLRRKRTEESLSLAQMSLEETACSVQRKYLQRPSCWATVLIMVLCGWVEMTGDSSASQMYGQRGKGHAVEDGQAPVSPLPCSSNSAWGDQGSSTTAAVPTQPQ